jgi:LmbE family N-acetylglucosaminyl deacetylase
MAFPINVVWERFGRPRRAVAVIAHPDDESFGLGAVLAALVDAGTSVSVLCLTQGEASTLGATADLGACREIELRAAAQVIGVTSVALFDFADGHLGDVDEATLDHVVEHHTQRADLLVVFEPGGVTGHPDHRAATAAAHRVAARAGISVLEWGVSPTVASALHDEFGVPFVPFDGDAVDVDRTRQQAAIACHRSQAADNAVLARRLALQGSGERVRHVGRPAPGGSADPLPMTTVRP